MALLLILAQVACLAVPHGITAPGTEPADSGSGDTADTAIDTGADTATDSGDSGTGGDTSDTADTSDSGAGLDCSDYPVCEGTVTVYCNEAGTALESYDCALSGQVCGDDGEGNPAACIDEVVVDTGDTTDRDVCYMPETAADLGQMYLDGINFSYWDTDPAASITTDSDDMDGDGDTTEAIACKVVPLEDAEEFLANAWYIIDASSGSILWAAYNNNCESVEWRGSLYVDSYEADVEAVPWSEEEWETNPCDIGADGQVAWATSPY